VAARPYIGRNILVETGPVEVLLELALHTVLPGVAGAEVVMVMGEDVPDDAGIVRDIQSVAGVFNVVQEASHDAVCGVRTGGSLDQVVSGGGRPCGCAQSNRWWVPHRRGQRRAASSDLGVGRGRRGRF
jgi:hypothetical protein